jgi:hypothetical protein
MPYRRLFVPALLLACAALWPSPARMQDAPTDPHYAEFRAHFHGVWRRSVPEARAREVIDAAIEQTVSAMNFFVRGIARGQLRDNTPLNGRIDLLFADDGRITVMFDGDSHRRYRSRIGHTVLVHTPDGAEMRMTQRFRDDGKLEQVFQTDQGTRWNVYESTGEGRMRVAATTQGMMMPSPLFFTFDYARDAEAAH